MKHLDLLNEFRELMAQLSTQVEASSAMQHYDINKVSENLVLGVLRELYGWRGLRNLNGEERANFPGIDLADGDASIAIQVTGTASLDKVKSTIETCLNHGLDRKYDRLVMYVLTRRQSSYSQDALDRVGQGRIQLRGTDDIWDFRDVCAKAAEVDPKQLAAALDVVRTYMRGGTAGGLADEDFDPPSTPCERVNLNLVEVYFPGALYIADLRTDLDAAPSNRHRNERRRLRELLNSMNLRVPSGYVVRGQQLITFHPLDDSQGPFAKLIDLGTVTPLRPHEFYRVSEDQERVFKSLLRFTLQEKLFQHGVRWMHEDGVFVFVPLNEGEFIREESWIGQRTSTRRVYERKLNKNDPNKALLCKHFAFSADFVLNTEAWYVALTPDWYFSYGDDYRRSAYADQSITWLKRREVNRTVSDHFRFLTAWLNALDGEDLFASAKGPASFLTFGQSVSFTNHPVLNDEAWLPLRDPLDDDDDSPIRGLFDTP